MTRVQLVHWKEAEGRARAGELRAAGLRVDYEGHAPAALAALKDEPPDVVAIDLTRLPSHGREIAWSLRQSKKTRHIPLVFIGGAPEKVARIQKELPDATFAEWSAAPRAIERAARNPPRAPVVPASKQFYGDKPLAGKLGIRPGSSVALVEAPDDFESTLGSLPEGARLRSGMRGKNDFVLWFVRSKRDYERGLPRMVAAAGSGSRIWVGWPKKASSVPTDLTQDFVRETPLAHGLVDFKICSIDETWSGICFAQRRPAGDPPQRKTARR